jgi:SAM-dependent methyltransferase
MQNPGADWYEHDTRYVDRNFNPHPRPVKSHRLLLRFHAVPGGKLLDIGMGTGNMLQAARAAGYQVCGLDFDHIAIQVAREYFGLDDVHVADLATFHQQHPERRFDVVTFFEVLEHVDFPKAFISNVAQILEPGGYISLSVPYRRSWDKFKTADVPPRHLSRWSRTSMRNFLESNGFEIVQMRRLLVPFYRMIILYHWWTQGYLSFGLVQKAQKAPTPSVAEGTPKAAARSIKVKTLFVLAKVKDYTLFTIPALLTYAYLIVISRPFGCLFVIARKKI